MDTIVNKVAESGIITIDLSEFVPHEGTLKGFDMKPFLFREMILREKDYRAALLAFDWTPFEQKHTAIFCSTDAIIPMWAFMLGASYLQPVASSVYFGSVAHMREQMILKGISAVDPEEYADKRVVIKGCGDTSIPESAYVAITALLRPVVKSLMYGEPCSTVPVFKRK